MKKGDILELDVTDINNLGCGIGRADGKVVFVKGAVTGDRVRTIIIKDNKSYAVGRLDAVISPSAHRESVEFCTAPLSCGGCVYRHVSYEHELTVKKNHVRAAFDKAGLSDVTVLDVVGTMQTNGYRNKAQYPVIKTKNGMRSGFYASKTHTVIPVDNCSIQNPIFADITSVVCELCDKLGISAYDELSGKGLLRHIYLRVAEATNEVMLCMVVNGSSLPCEKQFADEIVRRFPNVVSVMLNENTENTNVVLGKKYRTLYGKAYIEDVLCGLRFLISPDSFYQVNRRGAELLYSLARDAAALTGNELLADLYCGTGTIGLSMAADVRELIGIEIVEGAVKCAKQNAEYNGITNANFFCGDASSPQTVLNATGGKCPDVVVIDPPRKGSTKELVDCLAELRVPRIVYVSCDATTLARDCAWFREAGYEIGAVQPVDMFPRTGHVESVVCLTKSDNAT
ncbi:MAG: 23S rRNA (uracil(1939)-C(5))-methyltransferase RlmD [Ruminococcaceae bacterium]|nr:23S rRNA (uracil(1939)-C(5))-methyltransferase RlmD [Oscillospiraceae bacterium]